jgi:hypothetical protein
MISVLAVCVSYDHIAKILRQIVQHISRFCLWHGTPSWRLCGGMCVASRGAALDTHLDLPMSRSAAPFCGDGATLSTMDRFKRQGAPSVEGFSVSSHSRLRTAAPNTGSGEHAVRYALVREVLLAYLSPILVDSVLERALLTRRATASSLSEAELLELASDIMVGLRLFVKEERLPQLMLELADALELRG